MNHDELFERLRSADPVAGASVEPHSGPRAAALMEQIMHTDPNPPADVADTAPAPARRPRRALFATVGAVALAAAGVLAFVALRGDDSAPTSVTFAMASPNPAQMCINVDGIESDPSWSGFRGTVIAVDAGSVTLEVTQWYRGGDADQVVLTVPEGDVALEGGTEFVQGADMLVGVMDGTTLGCGISGPYSPEQADLYTKWFG